MSCNKQGQAPAWRCLLVWSLATAACAMGATLGLQTALDAWSDPAGPATFDDAVVALASAVAVAVCPWLWILATLGVLDALRGRTVPAAASRLRRLTMLACGCVAGVAVALPAHAATPSPGPVHVLDGLPYPDRPTLSHTPARDTGRAATPAAVRAGATPASAPSPGTYVVRPGDTLWSLATDALQREGLAEPRGSDVARTVARLHRTNASVIGDDPDLIVPGQRLALDRTTATHREDPR